MIRGNGPITQLTMPESKFSTLALYRRLAAFVWLLAAALALLLFPFAPPDKAIGDAGWWLAGACVLTSLGIAAWIARPASRITVSWLSWGSFLGLGQVALLQWLAGGVDGPYNSLLLLNVFASASLHPRSRMPAYLALVAAVAGAPRGYYSWGTHTAAEDHGCGGLSRAEAGGRRGGRGLLPARLRQSRARADRGRDRHEPRAADRDRPALAGVRARHGRAEGRSARRREARRGAGADRSAHAPRQPARVRT